jgi:ABC-type glutathione transport system ATPase component
VLEVSGLSVHYATGRGNPVVAVDDVSFGVGRGEFLAIVGESGCGKSMTALSLRGSPPGRSRSAVTTSSP